MLPTSSLGPCRTKCCRTSPLFKQMHQSTPKPASRALFSRVYAFRVDDVKQRPGSVKVPPRKEFATGQDDITTIPDKASELLDRAARKWDQVENKPAAIALATAAVVGVSVAINVVNAVNRIPLVPWFLEVVGLSYTTWFCYWYLIKDRSGKDLQREWQRIQDSFNSETESAKQQGKQVKEELKELGREVQKKVEGDE